MHGYGVLYARNGDKYTGEFANNLFDGSGLYEYVAYRNEKMEEVPAAKYEGSFKSGRKHGRGVFYQRNGDVYSGLCLSPCLAIKEFQWLLLYPVGMFENDLYHGEGLLRMANGDVINGNFIRGRASKHCEIKYKNGDHYVGNLFRGLYSGEIFAFLSIYFVRHIF